MNSDTPGARKAIVTGAAAGLGRDIAIALAEEGYRVALTDIDEAGLAETAGHNVFADVAPAIAAIDLRSQESIDAVLDTLWDQLGGIDLLVNNAGVTIHKPAVDLTWSDWDAVHDVNLKGAFFLSRAYARRLKRAKQTGAIVNIASAHGIVGFPQRSAYGISKAGIIHMTKMLAVEWAPDGIRVNAVAPGTVMTPSRQELLKNPAKRAAMLGRIPLGRFPTAAEVAAAVVYLAAPESGSVTGHTLVLDGGTTVA